MTPPDIRTSRLQLRPFAMDDAEDVFHCTTPAVARYMRWDPPPNLTAYKASRQQRLGARDGSTLSLVVRRIETMECLGVAGLEALDQPRPEVGLWLKESGHGQGYGTEVVAALVAWAARELGKQSFLYPVAVENVASRRIAEKLHGQIIGTSTNPKYESVIFLVPAHPSP